MTPATKKTYTLPKLSASTGAIYEEYVAAILQSAGQYIERNIVDRQEGKEILELDIIATDYNNSLPTISLIEVKSGQWGAEDIFKTRGWMDYLNLSEAVIVGPDQDKKKQYEHVCKKLSITLVPLIIKNEEITSLEPLVDVNSIEKLEIDLLRFSHLVERALLKRLKSKKKKPIIKECSVTKQWMIIITE